MSTNVRVRFAPSPTGMLHIGGLRTALYNYLFAHHNKGKFILRIEDTDQNRYVEGAEEDIITSLKWAGMMYDEGPDAGGGAGPYRQSERSTLYKQYAEQLLKEGRAYYAFDTPEEIEAMRERLKTSENTNPKYDAVSRQHMTNSLTLSQDETTSRLDSGAPYVIRLKIEPGETVQFNDLIREAVSFRTDDLDDQVLMKSDGLPTYHLANVVDDHLMDISHVIRGEEWLSSAPKHILLYRYLGWEAPVMAHLPLIMSPAGGKLSKRNAEALGIPVNVRDYISGGYEPDALINFLAFLGWSPGDDRELFRMQELIEAFTLEDVSKSGAVFNIDKLTWYNEQYMRSRTNDTLVEALKAELLRSGITGYNDAYLDSVVELMKERVSKTSDMVTQGMFFFAPPTDYDEKATAKAWKTQTPLLLEEFLAEVEQLPAYTAVALKETLSQVVERNGVGFGKLMLPARIAITGTGGGPDLFETMELLGKDEVMNRVKTALKKV
ncbi:MAG: glutamate--tRNA ligase [Bacteroidetes bacterium]|nr:glutamate--tRNA ligase [Bacteroidota bacterium]MCH8523491.1 glutamate--tRNA ligase [Balneolales bacterium]